GDCPVKMMEVFSEYLSSIDDAEQRKRVEGILQWIADEYPHFGQRIGWNQPMFTDHGTFIIAFNVAKKHLNVSTEFACIEHFDKEISKAGYNRTKMFLQVKWDEPVDFDLLRKMIDFNVEDKKDCKTFWRK
ncbi:MAG TPA: iron chaperone, partial [Clostridia bacterium]|nr:iron chaperone [Clostridia bacterium]